MNDEESEMADVRGTAGDDATAEAFVDGNALAGTLAMLFGADVTMAPGRCTHCHTVSMIGELRGYVRGPGSTLRCPACDGVVIRIVDTPDSMYLDLRGVSYLRFRKD
jgi:hypothetical protein